METPDSDSDWNVIYDYFSEQTVVYGGPICHVGFPEPLQLVGKLIDTRADADEGFKQGIHHSSLMVAAYCTFGMRRLIAERFDKGLVPAKQLQEEHRSLLQAVRNRMGKVKYSIGSFGMSKTLESIANGS